MAVDLTKLTPWRIHDKIPEMVVGETIPFVAQFAAAADAERCVLLAAADEIMKRREWSTQFHHGRWMVSVRTAVGMDIRAFTAWIVERHIAGYYCDPATALIEADAWMKANG